VQSADWFLCLLNTPTMTTDKFWRRPKIIRVAAVGFFVAMAMAFTLRFEGRLLICSCNRFLIWVGNICSSNNSQQLFDPYSFTHVLHGFLLFWIISLLFRRVAPEWQISLALICEAAWEIFENTPFVINRYRTETAALGYAGDTVVNSLGDLLCAFVGILIARQLGYRRSVILFLVIEVILLFTIRDSLLLEILMLIRPIAVIKHWQLCL
jgi:uncharacterized protein DUF2585